VREEEGEYTKSLDCRNEYRGRLALTNREVGGDER
jgi:hypothetical protein